MPTMGSADQLTEMNVKSMGGNALNIDTVNKAQPKERVKTFESSDRDANGKQEQADHEQERELSEEELQQAFEALKALPAVVQNELQVELREGEGSSRRFFILGPGGEVIRTLTPFQAFLSTKRVDEERPKGQLLNKST